jgi:hypothetical protein
MIQLVMYAWIWNRMVVETSQSEARRQARLQKVSTLPNSKTISTPISEPISLNSVLNGTSQDNDASAYDAYLSRTYNITRTDLYQFKNFKLMNIRTGEVRELNTASPLLNEIVEIILASKLRIRQQLTNEEFIEQQRTRINKYIPTTYRTLDSLIEEEEANRPILDF